MFDVAENIRSNVRTSVAKKTQQPECGWEGSGDNEVYFLTVNANALPGVQCQADFSVKLPVAYKHFLLVSITNIAYNNSLFLHLRPLGKAYPTGVAAITPDGTENWLSMKMKSGADVQALLLKFSKGVNEIFLDWGFEAGGGTSYKFTILCSNGDFDFVPLFQIGIL